MSRDADIKILMTTDTVGGVWTYSCSLAASLAASGAEVTLATMGPPARADQREMLRDSRVRLVETDLALEWQDPEGRDFPKAERVLAGLEARLRPDVAHLNSFREATLPWHAPTVLVAHSCVNSWALACQDSAWLGEPRWARYTDRVAAALNSAQAWVCPSQSFHDDIVEIYHPRSPGAVIWNGIAAGAAPSRKRELIFAAGRLWDRAKNIEVLAEAAPGLDWPVEVAGPAEIDPLGIAWLGPLPHSALREHLRHAPIFVSPALYEPFGLSVLEAAAAGCALVLSDIPTFRELWSGAALFFDAGDSQALHRILVKLCADDLERTRLQRAAYEHSLTYSLARTTSAYLKLYEGLHASDRRSTQAGQIEVRA
ncbi:glycosyltransferase involved in cell wall biosynthesis [Bradyrhizobium sp. CIR48]|uniref:glycosyltransferase family 4 protein n=1 Tax=unclassified Bradyrhizobium TaxID=2631580 RepID=UPI0016064716|nr:MULTISPECIES: glycosyltransferase family 4 protein [unclassified Bradyrhizobium]MBB4366110.1 glycosyltransferase involved in cell wall biosynthesis [Bradyrhizobium sp. CIR18]MBB4429381.1 glycosyltransferase involved in cell wall biosynthesis [Bradyrhizobium sp. CIR48]